MSHTAAHRAFKQFFFFFFFPQAKPSLPIFAGVALLVREPQQEGQCQESCQIQAVGQTSTKFTHFREG